MPILVKFGFDLVRFCLLEVGFRLFSPDSPVSSPDSPALTGQSGSSHRTVRCEHCPAELHRTVRRLPPDSPAPPDSPTPATGQSGVSGLVLPVSAFHPPGVRLSGRFRRTSSRGCFECVPSVSAVVWLGV